MRSRSLTLRLTVFFALVSETVLLGAGGLIGMRVQAHFVETDLADMQGKLELVRHLLARSRSPDSVDAVDGDRPMIRRALSNLLANAIRHTPNGEAVRMQIDQRPGDGVELRICNPGSIASEHLPGLFERFYQVEPSWQSTGGSAGLGLAITRSIVVAHSGTIRAESRSGEVCFTIDWPGAAATRAADTA